MPPQEALAGYRAVRRNGLKFIHQYVIYTHLVRLSQNCRLFMFNGAKRLRCFQ